MKLNFGAAIASSVGWFRSPGKSPSKTQPGKSIGRSRFAEIHCARLAAAWDIAVRSHALYPFVEGLNFFIELSTPRLPCIAAAHFFERFLNRQLVDFHHRACLTVTRESICPRRSDEAAPRGGAGRSLIEGLHCRR
jgi:hypothetical protein